MDVDVRPNRGITGSDVFNSESGIVAAWYLKCKDKYPCTLYPFHWDLVGRDEAELILGKWCGKPTVLHHLEKIGVTATDEQIDQIVMKVKDKGYEVKRRLSRQEFEAIVQEVVEGA